MKPSQQIDRPRLVLQTLLANGGAREKDPGNVLFRARHAGRFGKQIVRRDRDERSLCPSEQMALAIKHHPLDDPQQAREA